MTITHIRQIQDFAQFDDQGPVGVPLSEPACIVRSRKIAIPGAPATRTGIWECSPGKFRRQVEDGEIMHMLAGECSFIPDGQPPLKMQAGDTLFMPPNTQGVWARYASYMSWRLRIARAPFCLAPRPRVLNSRSEPSDPGNGVDIPEPHGPRRGRLC